MKRSRSLLVCLSLMVLAFPILLSSERAEGADTFLGEPVLEFQTMVGIDGAFLGSINPIRGINGGGRPWVLKEGKGKLEMNGSLRIKVRGLIIPDTEPGFGFNPAPFFLAAVSCLTTDGNGEPAIQNVFTQPADTKMIGDPRNGDANIKAKLMLPASCVAPIVFVTSPGGAWFAATGY